MWWQPFLLTSTISKGYSYYCREPSNSESGNGDGGLECQASLTPHQQHQQYLGDLRPELDSFPDLEWEGQLVIGKGSEWWYVYFISNYRW